MDCKGHGTVILFHPGRQSLHFLSRNVTIPFAFNDLWAPIEGVRQRESSNICLWSANRHGQAINNPVTVSTTVSV